jgi:D-tyrosyl-tRNA(Tyr) deacylase
MVALIQRVKKASVTVDGNITGQIEKGLLILLGIHVDDTEKELEFIVHKLVQLRIFEDAEGKMNLSLQDVGGEALVVSQFTLYGDTRKGNRPSFIQSARPEKAEPLYERFTLRLSQLLGKPVPTGIFGAMMDVALVNDGPVTLWIEKKAEKH